MFPLTATSCTKCSSSLSTDNAAKAGKRYRTICKTCWAGYMRGYNSRNRENVRKRNRDYKLANPRKYKDSHLRCLFGIGLAEYEAMLAAQDGKCAACKGDNQVSHRRLAVDHCHTTGAVRGLLCTNCNTALGLVAEDISRLKGLISYLERSAQS